MIKRSGFLTSLTILCSASVGIVGGHYLDYLLAIPEHAHRQTLLASTGHSYLPTAWALAIAASIVSIISAIALGYMRSASQRSSETNLASLAIRLSAVQVAGFVALELLERLIAGGSFNRILLILLLGIAVQVLVAVVGATIVWVLQRTAEIVARILRRVVKNKSSASPFPSGRELADSSFVGPRSTRGPPVTQLLSS